MRQEQGRQRWRRPGAGLAGALAAALVVAAGVAVMAGPAQAEGAPMPVQIGSWASLINDQGPKAVNPSCVYSDGVVVAVGARILDAWGNATIEELYPAANLRSGRVSVAENGDPGEWYFWADAVCARGLSNPTRVDSGWSQRDSQPFKSIVAMCPSGRKLYGLGAQIDNGNGNVFIAQMTPNSTLTSATVIAYENGSYSGTWAVKAYAVCAAPAATMTVVSTPSADNSVSPKPVLNLAPCPSGTWKYGFGASISNAGRGSVTLDTLTMDRTPSGEPFASKAIGDENGAFAPNWTVTTYAICATPPYQWP